MVTSSRRASSWPGPWLYWRVILPLNFGIVSVMAAGASVNLSVADPFHTLGLSMVPEGLGFPELLAW